MEYKGKLYGKVGDIYFELLETSEDIDRLKEQNEKLKEALQTLKYSIDFTENEEGSSYIISQCDKDVISEAIKSCQS